MAQIYEIMVRGRITNKGTRYDPAGSHVIYATLVEKPGRPGAEPEFVPMLGEAIPLHLADELPDAIREALGNHAAQIAEAEQARDEGIAAAEKARDEGIEEAKKAALAMAEADIKKTREVAIAEIEKANAKIEEVGATVAAVAEKEVNEARGVANEAITAAQAVAVERDKLKGEVAELVKQRDALMVELDAVKAAPAPVVRTYLSDVWRRASDDESEKIQAVIDSLSVRERNMLNASQYLAHDHEEFGRIRDALVQAIGPGRADHILAPSEG